jgi:hypothetical protein
MAGETPVVGVVGLSALMRDLTRSTDPRAGAVQKYLIEAGIRIATPVADAARSAVPHETNRVSSGKSLEDDIRVNGTKTGATIRVGRKTGPAYAGWIEFGGKRNRPHTSQRTFEAGGRFLWPAARALQSSAQPAYEDAMQKAYDNFAWTNSQPSPEGVHD